MSAPPFDTTRPDTWPHVMTFAEVCQVLRISTRTGQRLRQRHHFPIPEFHPRLANLPRYLRDDVIQSLRARSGQASALERRKALHGVR